MYDYVKLSAADFAEKVSSSKNENARENLNFSSLAYVRYRA
jgi:hypothetical protein